MKNLILSAVLIALPVGLFAATYHFTAATPMATVQAADGPSLGDMTAFKTIVSDVQTLLTTGDLIAAEHRVTDFETAWDEAQKNLRPINTLYWGNIDISADAALKALRVTKPDLAIVTTTLADLEAELLDPSRQPAGSDATANSGNVTGITTTDANGRPLPCEVMLETFRSNLVAARLTDEQRQAVTTLQDKGTERCNADDDKRADDFFAQGLALMNH